MKEHEFELEEFDGEEFEAEAAEDEGRSLPKILLAPFLALMVVAWMIPYYGIRSDPRPDFEEIPSLEELNLGIDVSSLGRIENVYSAGTVEVTPIVRNVAARVVSSCEVSDVCYAKAVHYFVQQLAYVPDPEREYVQSAEETLYSGGGDCEDLVVLGSALLKAVNVKSRIVLGRGHAFLQVWLPDALRNYKSENDWVSLEMTGEVEFGKVGRKYLDFENAEYVYVY